MKTIVYCEVTGKGEHSFYLRSRNERYYLFSQKYRKGVQEYYKNGVLLDDSFDFSKSKHNDAIRRTMSKIPMCIKYLEKEYDLSIFNKKSINKKTIYNKSMAYAI